MEIQNQSTAVTITVNLTAKGLAQWEIKSAFPNVADSIKNLDIAIKEVREVLTKNELTEVHA